MALLQKKICLLGLFGVGKTSLLRRFVENAFEEKYLSTIGVKVDRKRLALPGAPAPLDLLIWDIAGLQENPSLERNYFRGAHGALLVHDVSRPETGAALAQLCAEFFAVAPHAALVVAGNKCDLGGARAAAVPALQKISGHNAARHFLTSAKTGENVESAFQALAALLR